MGHPSVPKSKGPTGSLLTLPPGRYPIWPTAVRVSKGNTHGGQEILALQQTNTTFYSFGQTQFKLDNV